MSSCWQIVRVVWVAHARCLHPFWLLAALLIIRTLSGATEFHLLAAHFLTIRPVARLLAREQIISVKQVNSLPGRLVGGWSGQVCAHAPHWWPARPPGDAKRASGRSSRLPEAGRAGVARWRHRPDAHQADSSRGACVSAHLDTTDGREKTCISHFIADKASERQHLARPN